MNRKVSVLLVVGLVLILVLAVFGGQALANGRRSQKFVPFKAEYIVYPEQPPDFGDGYMLLVIPGEGEGTHLGKSTWLAKSMRVDLVDPPPQPQFSEMVFTAANGDELYGHFFGFGRPNDAGGNYFWGGYEIGGGTGKFEGASGSGLYHGTCREICTLSFEGNLLYS
jgi:hypothetical protein